VRPVPRSGDLQGDLGTLSLLSYLGDRRQGQALSQGGLGRGEILHAAWGERRRLNRQ
jgi:hypothetical protein